jgi:predicted RNA-binding Zn-ribbon protein involved in translation (DUF1610 family)
MCLEEKPIDDFHKCRRQGNQSRCKECRRKHSADKYANDADLRERIRDGHYKYKYGMTRQALDVLREQQGATCALCEGGLQGGRKEHVDHCHETGKVRGILCSECNTGIGKLRDDPALLRRAANYIEGVL